MYKACFTGHRKINNAYYNHFSPTPEWQRLKDHLCTIIDTCIRNGITTFYTGMAIGVDTVAAEAVALVRALHSHPIKLIAAIPFPSQPANWPQAAQTHYQEILQLCNEKIYVNEDPYTPWKMHARDRFMVDNSSYVLAVWDGRQGGGTYITTKYGLEQNRNVYAVHPTSLEGSWQNA